MSPLHRSCHWHWGTGFHMHAPKMKGGSALSALPQGAEGKCRMSSWLGCSTRAGGHRQAGRTMECWGNPALPHHTPPGALHRPDLHLEVLRKCICLQSWEQDPLPCSGLGSAWHSPRTGMANTGPQWRVSTGGVWAG